ncbi:MAG: sulfotransferase [Phycisphaerales bacterium]|nr:MAG: sulfotransferase [Phycisphaerales bacterium]
MGSTIEDIYPQWRRSIEAVGRLDKLFIVGCAKSGTTWLQNLLHAHPQMVVRGEGCFTYQLVPLLSQAFGAFNKHQHDKDPITHMRDAELLLTARTLIDSQFARYISESRKQASGLRVVGDKTPQHTISLPALHQLYPKAKFINMIRDPRDVATSAWFHFGRNDQRGFEEYIRYFMTQVWPLNVNAPAQVAAQLGPRYRTIRYEDLHADEPVQLRDLLQFLGVDDSDAAVRACMEGGSFKRHSRGRERGQTDNDHFYRSGTVGDWQNHLPVSLIQACCGSIKPLMQEYGYDNGLHEQADAPGQDGRSTQTVAGRRR